MQKIYCSNCSNPNYFEFKKPNVCSSCANPFNAAFKRPVEAVKPPVVAKVTKSRIEDDNEETEEQMYDTEIENLKKIAKASAKRVKVSIFRNLKGEDLKNLDEKIVRDSSQSNSRE